jgi:hypothetical protein
MKPVIKIAILAGAVLLAPSSVLLAQEVLTATPEGDGTINFLPPPPPAPGGFLGEDPGNPLSSGNQSNGDDQIGILKFELPTLAAGQTFSNASLSFDFVGTFESPGGSETNSVSVGVYQPSNSDNISVVTSTDYFESLTATTIAPNLITPTSPTGVYTISSNATLDAALTAAYSAGDTSIAFSLTTPLQAGDTDVYQFETDTGLDSNTSQPSLTVDSSPLAAPEPSTLSLIACAALIGMGFRMLRRMIQTPKL